MAGTPKSLDVAQIQQGPGDLWFIGQAPTDASPRLTLAPDGTPDSTAHPGSIHLGAASGPIVVAVTPKIQPIELDQFDAPVDYFVEAMDMTIEAELAQSSAANFQRAIGVATESNAAGYDQITVGGINVVPVGCYAAITPKKADATKYWVSVIFRAVAMVSPPLLTITRKKPSFYKVKFSATYDFTRSPGKAVGI